MERLHQLEGYFHHAPSQGLYNRTTLPTQYGDAWCYIYNPAVEQGSLMDSGEW
nr:hypothetical protein [uncultured Halomonas sp.]